MQNKVADSVHAEEVYQGICVEHVALGLTHLAITL